MSKLIYMEVSDAACMCFAALEQCNVGLAWDGPKPVPEATSGFTHTARATLPHVTPRRWLLSASTIPGPWLTDTGVADGVRILGDEGASLKLGLSADYEPPEEA